MLNCRIARITVIAAVVALIAGTAHAQTPDAPDAADTAAIVDAVLKEHPPHVVLMEIPIDDGKGGEQSMVLRHFWPSMTPVFEAMVQAGHDAGYAVGFQAGIDAVFQPEPEPGDCIDLNKADVERLDELYGVGPALAQAIIDHRPFATVQELTRVPGIGEAKLAGITKQGRACVGHDPAVVAPPPMLLINCNDTPKWNAIDGVAWVVSELDAGYAAGVRHFVINGLYDGTPGIDESLPAERDRAFFAALGTWAADHLDTRIGLYARPNGQPSDWARGVMEQGRDGTRPIMRVIDHWAKALGGYNRVILALDASARHKDLAAEVYHELAGLGVLFIAEAHSDLHSDWEVPTIASVRWGWSKFHEAGKLPPDVRGSAAWRWAWDAKLPIGGKTVAELLDVSSAELIKDYALRGFGIVGDLESIAAYQAAISSQGNEQPRVWQALDNDGPVQEPFASLAPRCAHVSGHLVHGADGRYSVPTDEQVLGVIESLQLHEVDRLWLNNEIWKFQEDFDQQAIDALNAQLAVFRKHLGPEVEIYLSGPPVTYLRENGKRIRGYDHSRFPEIFHKLQFDGFAPQCYYDETDWPAVQERMQEWVAASVALDRPVMITLCGVKIVNGTDWGGWVKPETLAKAARLAMDNGLDVCMWASRIDTQEKHEAFLPQLRAIVGELSDSNESDGVEAME